MFSIFNKCSNYIRFIILLIFSVFLYPSTQANALCQRNQLPKPVQQFVLDEQTWESRPSGLQVFNRWQSEYAPHQHKNFEIMGCYVDLDYLNSIGEAQFLESNDFNQSRLASQLKRHYDAKTQVLFFIHPEFLKDYKRVGFDPKAANLECKEYCATATSSNRTLVVWSDDESTFEPVMVKTSINVASGGYVKTVSDDEAKKSVMISNALEEQAKNDPQFDLLFFKEPLAVQFKPKVTPEDKQIGDILKHPFFKSGAGIVYRAFPEELLKTGNRIITSLAIYGDPVDKDGRNPYLLQEAQIQGVDNLLEDLRYKFIRPFAQIWLKTFIDWGITLEPHGQNLLVELDTDNRLTGRLWHRDLDGLFLDNDLRSFKDMPLAPNVKSEIPAYSHRSMVNIFIKLLLTPMATAIESWEKTHKLKPSDKTSPSIYLEKILIEELRAEIFMRAENSNLKIADDSLLNNVSESFSWFNNFINFAKNLRNWIALDQYAKKHCPQLNSENEAMLVWRSMKKPVDANAADLKRLKIWYVQPMMSDLNLCEKEVANFRKNSFYGD